MKCLLKIGVIYVLLFFIGTARICAQPTAYFRNLDVSDGLPSNYITAIHEDQKGYKWIGTEDGLQVAGPSSPTDNYSVAYSQFVMPLVKAVQEQQEMIELLVKEMEEMKKLIDIKQ